MNNPLNPLLIELYRDRKKLWRIRLMRSGKIIFVTGEGYNRKRGAINALDASVKALMEANCKYNF